MTKYVKINDGVTMYGAELEHGRVYPVLHSVGEEVAIEDAAGWPYSFAASEYEEVPMADWEYELLHQEGEHGVDEPEFAEAKIEKESARLVDEQREFDKVWETLYGVHPPKTRGQAVYQIHMLPKVKDPAAPTVEELNQGIDISAHITDISGFTTTFELGEWQEAEEDGISNPSHYSEGMPEGLEVRDIIKAQGFWKEFCAGNVIKYSLRWQYKNGVEDLKKMLQYGQWLAEELEDEDA